MSFPPLKKTCVALFAVLCVFAARNATLEAENWPRFRGENGVGVSPQKGLPVKWSPGDYAWNIELPGVGHSSPIIWGDKLFVTSAIDDGAIRYLHCLDAKTGKKHWSRVFGLNRSHKHAKGSWASSTPTADGEQVYVAFSDDERYTLAAYDYDGNLAWRRSLGSFESQHGQGVSPVVFEDMVFITNDQKGPSSVVALNKHTGDTVWSVLRSVRKTSYATPMILKLKNRKPQLITVSGAMGITSLDPYTGNQNWITGEFPQRTVASPVFGEGLLIASCGGGGVGSLLIAVDPTGKGDVSASHVKYRRERLLPYVPTPIIYRGHLYLWNDNGVVSCVEIKTGKNVWTKRVENEKFSGSPVCIDGKLYCMSEAGDMIVVAASPQYKFLGKTPLGDFSHATPALANGRLYLRTFHRLACLEAKP